ncbi:N-acetylgalactosamine kinase isoform X2 [Temnothorax americanus]
MSHIAKDVDINSEDSEDSEENIYASTSEPVPILAPSADILPRLKTLAAHFTSKYNVGPSFFVRVPGRVNLIGEHIDYCGYPVLPMAIEQNILIAFATTKNNEEIHLTNVDPKYKDFRCSFENLGSCISDSESGSAWYKYFLCGVKGAVEIMDKIRLPPRMIPKGILAAVWGNIPPNSGLSSSSALVSAALLSVIHGSKIFVKHRCPLKRHLATISARAERHIGTQGGGMDQAIAFFATAGKAKLIEFPSNKGELSLRASDVTLTEGAVFVIAHSQAYHNKASTADYNLRVAECRLAAQIIAEKRNIKEIFKSYAYQELCTCGSSPNMDSSMGPNMDSNIDPYMYSDHSYRDCNGIWNEYWESTQRLITIQETLRLDLDDMVTVVMTELHEEPYTLDEICESLGMDYEQLKEKTPLVSSFNISQTFKLQQRALHVYQEAGRVRAFCRINKENPRYDICRGDKTLQELGNLMSESHTSLQKLYECSHPSVDALVERAMLCGAFGARLTGAGWGGCIVALVDKNRVQQFVEDLREYLCQNSTKDRAELEDMVFPTSPNDGAVIYTVPTL